jgi:hypothetical protein
MRGACSATAVATTAVAMVSFFGGVAVDSVVGASAPSSPLLGRGFFGVPPPRRRHHHRNSRTQRHPGDILFAVARGGGGDEPAADDDDDDDAPLYFPGLLDAVVVPPAHSSGAAATPAAATASSDCAVSLTRTKASELKLKSGNVVAVIGKRRRASYARVVVISDKEGGSGGGGGGGNKAKIGRNLASNLRIRDDDKLRIVTLDDLASMGEDDDDEHCDGAGSYGLGPRPTAVASSVTFHPLKDSASSSDEAGDDELSERFVRPYLDSSASDEDGAVALLRQGHVLSLVDESGVVMEFSVGHLDVEGGSDDDEKGENMG